MTKTDLGLLAAAIVMAISISFSRAHSVWIEPAPGGSMRIRFAEPDGKLETSPGHLDSLTIPVGFVVVTNTAIAIEARKGTNAFHLSSVTADQAIGFETSFVVMGALGKTGRKPNFYARWSPSLNVTAVPGLNLDIVPTGRQGEARIYFRGNPLPGAKAVLRSPDETEKEVTADAGGFLRFETTQKGFHHLSVARHRESLAGFHLGKPYDLTSHNSALTWNQP